MKRGKYRNGILLVLLSIGIPVFLAGMLYAFIYGINQFSLDLTIHGEREITVEYGGIYEDAGAEAMFSGTHIYQDGIATPVTVTGDVDVWSLGTYEIRYHTSYERWVKEETRIVHVVDSEKPRIWLKSSPAHYTMPGESYQEEGFVARDNHDGDITDQVVRTDLGKQIIYWVEDASGNDVTVSRKVIYYDPIPPELTLTGEEKITLTEGGTYAEPGFTAADNCDGDLTARVKVEGKVNTAKPGTYTLKYYIEDSYGNSDSATRTVVVKAKPKPQYSGSSGGSGGSQTTVTPNGKVIYLTFDDGPGKYTGQLLDVLAKYNVKATFFVINNGYASTLRRIVNEGHSIGLHTASHSYKNIYASEDAFFADLEKMQSVIRNATGVTTYLMRFPGGSSNTVSSFNPGIMTRLAAAVEDRGYRYFDWNVSSGDAGGTTSTEKVYQNVINGVQKRNVSIVLQHDIKSYSVAAVEKIILWGLENGYTFLPLTMTSPTAHHSINN